jgi:hypothetical protein
VQTRTGTRSRPPEAGATGKRRGTPAERVAKQNRIHFEVTLWEIFIDWRNEISSSVGHQDTLAPHTSISSDVGSLHPSHRPI